MVDHAQRYKFLAVQTSAGNTELYILVSVIDSIKIQWLVMLEDTSVSPLLC